MIGVSLFSPASIRPCAAVLLDFISSFPPLPFTAIPRIDPYSSDYRGGSGFAGLASGWDLGTSPSPSVSDPRPEFSQSPTLSPYQPSVIATGNATEHACEHCKTMTFPDVTIHAASGVAFFTLCLTLVAFPTAPTFPAALPETF